MKRCSWLLLACFFLTAVLPLGSQSAIDLVALKKKEEERRKKISKSKQAINDTNVAMIAGAGKSYGFVQMESETPSAEANAAEVAAVPGGTEGAVPETAENAAETEENAPNDAEASASPEDELGGDMDETKRPEYWKNQQTDLQGRIAELKEGIRSEQSQLNKLWSDFYIKNIPAEQDAIKVQIGSLTNQLEQKKLFLSQAETQLEELFEKARKAGVPPGWLR